MAEVGSAYVTLLPSAKGFGSKLNSQVGGDVDRAGKTIGKRFGGVIAGGASLLIGGAVGGILKSSLSEAREAQKVGAQTNAVIRSTGGAAKVTATHVGSLATALSKKVGIDDEVIQSGQNMLLTFKNIRNEAGKGNKIFDQATKTLVDMSVAMGEDPKQAAIKFGKALNDPIKGITALSRVGVTFSDSQKKTITKLVETGHTLKAQKIILHELNSEFGGSAKAQATAGDKARVAWQNLEETIGTALLPVVDRLENTFTTKVAPAVSKFVGEMQSGKGAGGDFADVIGDLAGAAKGVVKFIGALPGPVKKYGAEAAIAAVAVGKLLKVTGGMKAIGGLGSLAGKLGGGGLGSGLGGAAGSARPVPVFVTNEGFGAGGGVGGGGGGVVGGKGGKLSKVATVGMSAIEVAIGAAINQQVQDAIGKIGSHGKEGGILGAFDKPRSKKASVLAGGSSHSVKHDTKSALGAQKFGGVFSGIDQKVAGLIGGDGLSKSVKNVKDLDSALSKLSMQDQTKGWDQYNAVLKKSGLSQEQLNRVLPKTASALRGTEKATGGIRDALLQTVPTTAKYARQLNSLPKAVQTKVQTPGAITSLTDVRRLQKTYHLTPKQVRTLIALSGAKQGKSATDQLIKSLNVVDHKHAHPTVTANTGQAHSAILNVKQMIDGLHNKTVTLTVNTTNDMVKGHRATGGPIAAGSTYLVGERGPELFTSNQAGRITPNNKLGSGGATAVGGGGGDVTLHLYDSDDVFMGTMTGVADERYYANGALAGQGR